MQRWSFRPKWIVCGISALFSFVSVAIACSADPQLDYHIVEPSEDIWDFLDEIDDPSQVPIPTACSSDEQSSFRYTSPSGHVFSLSASASPAFSVDLRQTVRVNLIKFPSPYPDEAGVVFAEVIPVPRILKEAAEHRRRLEQCDLLIRVGDQTVGVIHGGTGQWEDFVPGGTFTNYEAAEAPYAGLVGSIDRSVASDALIKRDAAIADWISRRDDWLVRCSPELMSAYGPQSSLENPRVPL
jgi:hypothetical protein